MIANKSLAIRSRGYAALLSVLILGAMSLSVAIVLLRSGTDNLRSSLASQQSSQARKLADACAEEALQQIHDNTAFTGSGSLTLGAGDCNYTVTNTGGSNRLIVTDGTVNDVVRKTNVYVTILVSSISITSYQEVQ